MPMRGELAAPTLRAISSNAADDRQAWLLVGLCAIGVLAATCTALNFVPFDQIPMLVAQFNLG